MLGLRSRVVVGLCAFGVCGGLAGCSSQESSGWSGRVSAGGSSGSLSAGDPLGQALYAAHRRQASRDADVERLFGSGVLASDLRESSTAVAAVPE